MDPNWSWGWWEYANDYEPKGSDEEDDEEENQDDIDNFDYWDWD